MRKLLLLCGLGLAFLNFQALPSRADMRFIRSSPSDFIELTGRHYDAWKAGRLTGRRGCMVIGKQTEDKPPYADVDYCACITNRGYGADPKKRRAIVLAKVKRCGSSPTAQKATLTVPNTKPVKVYTPFATQVGGVYSIEASGYVSDWADKQDGVDAVWCYAEWRCGKSGQVWDQLRIDGKGMTDYKKPIPYNSKHVYQIEVPGTGRPFEFYMLDAQGSSSDNHGSLTVVVTRKR